MRSNRSANFVASQHDFKLALSTFVLAAAQFPPYTGVIFPTRTWHPVAPCTINEQRPGGTPGLLIDSKWDQQGSNL